jgi:hypothetical protein
MPRFSSSNRITADMIASTKQDLCRGAFGTQSDIQCMGYDRLCALAALFKTKGIRDSSYHAVVAAQNEIRESEYSRGFQTGWDGRKSELETEEYKTGYEDGTKISRQWGWHRSLLVSDVAAR